MEKKEKVPIEFPMYDPLDVSYSIEEVNPLDLKVKGNPAVDIVNLSYSSHYKEDSRRFSHIEIPVVTQDGLVLSHKEDVEVAIELGFKKVKVQRVLNLNEKEYIRFSLKSVYFFELCAAQRFELIKLLTIHLRTVDTEWDKELTLLGFKDVEKDVLDDKGDTIKDDAGKKITKWDINDKLGYLLRCNKETVKDIKRIGEAADIKRQVSAGLIPEPVKPIKKERPKENVFEISSLRQIEFDEIAISFDKHNILIQKDNIKITPSFYSIKESNGMLCIQIPVTNFLPIKLEVA